jgi:hypothetical protein
MDVLQEMHDELRKQVRDLMKRGRPDLNDKDWMRDADRQMTALDLAMDALRKAPDPRDSNWTK